MRKSILNPLFSLFFLVVLLSYGCSHLSHSKSKKSATFQIFSQKIGKKDEFLDKVIKIEKQIKSLKKKLTLELYPSLKTDKKITLNVKEAPLKDVFKVLAEKGNFGLVFDFKYEDTDKKTVTGYFKDTPVELIVKKIAKSLHLCYSFSQKTLILKDYLSTTVYLPVFLFNDSASFSSDVVEINVKGNFGDDLERDLKEILGELGKVLINARTGMVFLEGPPEKVIKGLTYLENVRNKLLKYLFVRIYIVKINTQKTKEHGIDFEQLLKIKKKTISLSVPPGIPTTYSLGLNVDAGKIKYFLKLIRQKSLGEIVSSPFFIVRNNSMAGIKITSQVGWLEPGDIETITGGNTSTLTQGKPTFKTIDVGVSISIYPKILTSNVVQVLLSLKDTSFDRFITYPWQPAPGMEPITLQYPLISKREFVTQIVAVSGKYVILGGFRESRKNREKVQPPVLGNIPLMGKLFTYSTNKKEIKDLYLIISFVPL